MSTPLTRRTVIKTLAATAAVAAVPPRFFAATAPSGAERKKILDYLARHARPDGGYAFEDQEMSHLTPTFAVIGALRLLQALPAESKPLAQYVRTHHPRELKKLEQERRIFEWQQIQALAWLGDDAADFRERISAFTAPMAYMKAYEQHGYPIFQSETGVVQSHALLKLPLAPLSPAFPNYVTARRRANGSYNNTPTADGGDGHVMNTLWGLQASRTLGLADDKSAETVAWLRACQLPSGGFTFQPQPMFGGVDDITYTRAAARALQLLGGAVANREACIAWILSLANADGGFSDRPGWLSNPLATFCALDALDALGALDALNTVRRRAPRARQTIPSNLKVFSAQVESHGNGSPAEAVALAAALHIDLWGAKNAKSGWIERARAIAATQKVPVKFYVADEEYGSWVHIPGLGTYSHTADIVAPGDIPFGAPVGSRGGGEVSPAVTWPEFRTKRLDPLHAGHGQLIWQFGENEELVRMFLDDSVERGGFAAISTFHFGNPDFTNTEPFLNRWRGKIPFISLQDAHGAEPWWFADITTGHRTLFLATEPTWDGWLNALQQNWTVAVRHDDVSKQKTWAHSGSPEVLEFVMAREREWRWWDNPARQRPLVSLLALTPADTLEVGHPESGIALRVRCAWKNTPQGFPQTPMSEFVKLTVDGAEVTTKLTEKKRPNGSGLADTYHLAAVPAGKPGRRQATVTVRELATNRTIEKTIEFEG